jgi:hypothetical protein
MRRRDSVHTDPRASWGLWRVGAIPTPPSSPPVSLAFTEPVVEPSAVVHTISAAVHRIPNLVPCACMGSQP